MDELNPLIIGDHNDAMQAAHRVVIEVLRHVMDHYLDQAQSEMDRYNLNQHKEAEEIERGEP